MCVMQSLTDTPREMGIGRGDDYPFGCFGLVLDCNYSSQRMFGFNTGLFISGEPENFLPMLGDKLAGEQQHSARCAVAYPLTSRAHELVTVRWNRGPRPPALLIHRLAFTADGWLPGFASPCTGRASALEPIDLSYPGEDVMWTWRLLHFIV